MSSLDSYSTVKTLFVLGTTTSAICSGGLLFTSYMHVPAYLKNSSDSTLLDQWRTMGAFGAAVVPPLTLIASGAHLANSYVTRSQQSQQFRFVTAGVLSLSILPYTFATLASTNAEFAARTKGEDGPDAGLRGLDLRELIQRWSGRSVVRGFLMLASTIVSYDAMLHLTW